MRRLFPSIIALLMVAGTLPAQTTDSPSTTKKDREPVGINLSLWKNMSTQQTDTVGSTCLNLGLFSSMNRLNGVGINLLGGVVLRDMNGVQITSLSFLRNQGIESSSTAFSSLKRLSKLGYVI